MYRRSTCNNKLKNDPLGNFHPKPNPSLSLSDPNLPVVIHQKCGTVCTWFNEPNKSIFPCESTQDQLKQCLLYNVHLQIQWGGTHQTLTCLPLISNCDQLQPMVPFCKYYFTIYQPQIRSTTSLLEHT